MVNEFYLTRSFKDFNNTERFVIGCLLVKTRRDCFVSSYAQDEEGFLVTDDLVQLAKGISFGFAVCNPIDEFNVESGKKIARNKAINATPKMWVTVSGILNDQMLTNLLDQEMNFMINNPDKLIKGYNQAKERYDTNVELRDKVSHLTEDELKLVQAVVNNSVDVKKCLDLGKQLKNKGYSV